MIGTPYTLHKKTTTFSLLFFQTSYGLKQKVIKKNLRMGKRDEFYNEMYYIKMFILPDSLSSTTYLQNNDANNSNKIIFKTLS